MNARRRGFVGFATAFVAAPAFALYDSKPDDALAATQGAWRGALTYRDYRQPDRRVTLPTRLFVAMGAPDTLVLHYVFDDGPGKTVYSYEAMRFDFAGQRVVWTTGEDRETSTSEIRASSVDGPTRRLVFERQKAKDAAVERFTMTLSAVRFEFAKDEVDAAGVASFRNRFVFARE